MKLLLTSGGVGSASIRQALVGLLGKPIEEAHALYIPTAMWGHPQGKVVGDAPTVASQGQWRHSPHPARHRLTPKAPTRRRHHDHAQERHLPVV